MKKRESQHTAVKKLLEDRKNWNKGIMTKSDLIHSEELWRGSGL